MTMSEGGEGTDADQAALDAQQAALDNIESQGPTNAQFQKLTDQVGQLLQATRSSQGLTSKGLDAVRRDTAEGLRLVRAEVEALSKTAQRDWINDLPEEQQEMAKRLLAEFDKGVAANAAPPKETPPQRDEPTGEENEAVNAWERIYASARMFGLDPRDPNIDYTMWQNTSIDDATRNNLFAKSLREAILKGGAQQTNGNPPPQTRAAAPKNPPTNGAPAGGNASQSFEQLRDKFISGGMQPEVYREEAAKLGVNV